MAQHINPCLVQKAEKPCKEGMSPPCPGLPPCARLSGWHRYLGWAPQPLPALTASSRPSQGSESPFSSGNSAERREGRYPRPQHGTHTEPPGHPRGWGHRRQGSAHGSTARDSQKNARALWDEPLAMGEPACQASCHGAWPEIPLRAREQGGSRKRVAERLSHGRAHGESQAEMAPGHPGLGSADAPHHLPTTSFLPAGSRGTRPWCLSPRPAAAANRDLGSATGCQAAGDSPRERDSGIFVPKSPSNRPPVPRTAPAREAPGGRQHQHPGGTRDNPEASEDS